MLKVQSKTPYAIGDIVYNDETGECFKVVNCIKFFMENNYGITLIPLTKEV